MRYKSDGRLDEVWRARPMLGLPAPFATKTPEQVRLELIEELLRHHPTMTREQATEQIDAFF